MKKLSVVIGLIALLALSTTGLAKESKLTPEDLDGIKIGGADQVKKWLDDGEDIFLLDARKTSDFEAGHLPDAENLKVPLDLDLSSDSIASSVAALESYEVISELEKDIIIIAYCNGDT